MNPVFWLLVILAAIALWLLLSILFQPLGKYISKIFNDTVDIINDKEDEEKEKDK